MKPSQAKAYLKAVIADNAALGARVAKGEVIPARKYHRVLLIGGVGVAKSAISAQASTEMGFDYWLHNLVHGEASDLSGIMQIVDGYQTWARPRKLPRKGEKKIIILDEVAQGERLQINAATGLSYDREVNGHEISEFATVICTANPVSARAGSVRLGNNTLTRFVQIEVKADVGDFVDQARKEMLDERVIAYIASKGADVLNDFDAARDINANPRTWEMAARQLDLGLTKALEMEAIAGCIGAKHMGDFYAFCSQRHSLAKPADIFANPLGAELPASSAGLYSVVTSLVAAATYDKFKAGLEYISRTNSTEFVMFYLNGLAQRDKKENLKPAFSSHPEYNRIILAINSQPTP